MRGYRVALFMVAAGLGLRAPAMAVPLQSDDFKSSLQSFWKVHQILRDTDVGNYGPAKATGIIVSNVLDPAMTFLGSSISTFTRSSNVVMVTVPDLASGTGTNFVLTLRPNPGNTTFTNTLFDTATVMANEIDLNPGNNIATSKVIVYPVPRVSMTRKLTQVVLSWPSLGGGNFIVEATDRLVPANWTVVTNTPSLSAGLMSVTIDPVKTNQFFRIRSP